VENDPAGVLGENLRRRAFQAVIEV